MPCEFVKRVHSSLSATFNQDALTVLTLEKISVLLKQMPKSASAGCKVNFDFLPVCKPIPSKRIGLLIVVCKTKLQNELTIFLTIP